MKDTYRERIKEEQKKLSPQQFFFSEGYQRLFQHLADEVAGEKLEQLLLYQNASDGIAGWNDGKRIGINVIIQSLAAFWNWNKKVTAWLEF